jgi:iron complex transport system ATP-binding protein
MLTAQNISYRVGKKTLLDKISANFEVGKLNLIIGANGAGKSTLIKILSNQLKAHEGEVFFADNNSKTLNLQTLSRYRAVLSQNIDLAFPLQVSEVVMMGRYPHFMDKPKEKDYAICVEAMNFFGVSDFATRDYMTLSGGEKQRTHFARVLAQVWYDNNDITNNKEANNLRYLFLDEPLTFLDIYYQFDFMHKITKFLQQGNLVVVGVIHDLNLVAKFADNIILLHQGKLLASGNKKDVLTTQNIKTAYQMDSIIKYEDGQMQLFFC